MKIKIMLDALEALKNNNLLNGEIITNLEEECDELWEIRFKELQCCEDCDDFEADEIATKEVKREYLLAIHFVVIKARKEVK